MDLSIISPHLLEKLSTFSKESWKWDYMNREFGSGMNCLRLTNIKWLNEPISIMDQPGLTYIVSKTS